jgi:hypothetical protein
MFFSFSSAMVMFTCEAGYVWRDAGGGSAPEKIQAEIQEYSRRGPALKHHPNSKGVSKRRGSTAVPDGMLS